MNILFYLSKAIKKLHIPAKKNSIIGKKSKVCSGTYLLNSTMGKYSYIGNFCTVLHSRIGNYCSIADNCIIGGASHPISWVSTSPIFHAGKNIMKTSFSKHPFNTNKETIIGNDVWIGNNCLIRSGITIGNGAVIGMGSVVTKNVEPYAIVGGNPARLIRYRFDEETIKSLLDSQWWDLDDIDIRKMADNIIDPKLFLASWRNRLGVIK